MAFLFIIHLSLRQHRHAYYMNYYTVKSNFLTYENEEKLNIIIL